MSHVVTRALPLELVGMILGQLCAVGRARVCASVLVARVQARLASSEETAVCGDYGVLADEHRLLVFMAFGIIDYRHWARWRLAFIVAIARWGLQSRLISIDM